MTYSALSSIREATGEGSTTPWNQYLQQRNPEADEPRRHGEDMEAWDRDLAGHHKSIGLFAVPDAGSQFRTNHHDKRRGNPKFPSAKQTSYELPYAVASKSDPTNSGALNELDDPYAYNPSLLNGTRLAHLSDTIPCLFGPNQYIEGYDAINCFNNPIITPKGGHDAPLFNCNLYSPHDSALLTVLTFASIPAYDRSPVLSHALKPFSSGLRGEKLFCYMSYGPSDDLLEIEIDLHSYQAMLGNWQRSQTSLDLRDNYQETISRSGKVLEILKQRSVAARKLEQQFLMHIVDDTDRETLLAKLDGPLNDLHSDQLQTYRLRETRQRQLPISETFDYTEPDQLVMDTEKLYTHRFSHVHPSGHLQDFKSDNVGEISQDNRALKGNSSVKRIDLGSVGNYFRRMGRLGRWSMISVCGLGVVTAVLVILYFRLGANNKKGFY